MQITKISFSKTVESCVLGAGVWQKFSVEADVSADDKIPDAIDEIRSVVEDAHKKYEIVQPIVDAPTNDEGFLKP